MKEKFLKQAEREQSPGVRIVALILEGILFVIILPVSLVYFSHLLDQYFKLPGFAYWPVTSILGGALIAAGLLFAWWSISQG